MRKMLKSKSALYLFSAFLLLPVLVLSFGCEADTDEDKSGVDMYFNENPYSGEEHGTPLSPDLEITPNLVAIGVVGQQEVLKGKGGVGPYAWSVGNQEYGRVDVIGWSEALYTCVKVGYNTVRVEDQNGHSALAQIAPIEEMLIIYPDSVELPDDAGYAAFSVSGGAPPYAWSVGNAGMGTVAYSANASHVASYVAVPGTYGVNVVAVTDSQGQTASAKITQLKEEE